MATDSGPPLKGDDAIVPVPARAAAVVADVDPGVEVTPITSG